MEASTKITGHAQDKPHAAAAGRRGAISKKIAAVAALGLIGFLSVTACTTTRTVAVPATPQPQPATTQTAQPTVPDSGAQPDPSPEQVARFVANVAVGNGPLYALAVNGVTATDATCDPATVSNPADPSTPTTASCDITYSDGSVWEQTVTITYDSQGDPVTASTNTGTELSQPTNE